MTTWGEMAIAETWLFSVLTGDATITAYATGGVHTKDAPEGTVAPYIVFVNKTDLDKMVVNQSRIWTDMTYDIQLVVPGNDIITGDAAYTQIRDLLHKGNGVTAGGTVIACTRTGTGEGNSLAAGVEYRHLVQTFSLLVQPN